MPFRFCPSVASFFGFFRCTVLFMSFLFCVYFGCSKSFFILFSINLSFSTFFSPSEPSTPLFHHSRFSLFFGIQRILSLSPILFHIVVAPPTINFLNLWYGSNDQGDGGFVASSPFLSILQLPLKDISLAFLLFRSPSFF